ncbi:MAG: NAD(P)H-dependent glycerol-3-phosphate dehydrogenase [Saprospiraceae bacterium]|nr:NAD(P)H-dependent glycerol-3-phosphate dehydrogenase [Saprospiraceae bacterium]MDW8483302.1 NAD(P)H-dependent glycerol-3-phosphate dehydrogenase [Saprospiraceae bacterium]
MDSDTRPVGVIGAGSFGIAIANVLACNHQVLLYSRKADKVEQINKAHQCDEVFVNPRVQATDDVEEITSRCRLLFPLVPSDNFRQMMRVFGPYLKPYHFLIHGTKGFDLVPPFCEDRLEVEGFVLSREYMRTMSEVILEESCVLRVGYLAGPSLAREILEGKPSAAVIASHFQEVIQAGQVALSSKNYRAFGSFDLLGAELAGAFKNIIALGAGLLDGHGLGRNLHGIFISRGLREMLYLGSMLGASNRAFLGIAGIGDMVTTSTSPHSRNYQSGVQLAKGKTVEQIRSDNTFLAEGIRTLRIVRQLIRQNNLDSPIMDILYKVVFEQYPIEHAVDELMSLSYDEDLDFLEMTTRPKYRS